MSEQAQVNPAMPTADDGKLRRQVLRDAVALYGSMEIADPRLLPTRALLRDSPADDELATLEATVLSIDDAIPALTFRERFRPERSNPEALCRVAALLARHANTAARYDRVEIIATRVLSQAHADGQLEALPEAQFLEVLGRITPPPTLTPERRDRSIAFFIHAAQRLETLTSAHDVFNSGLYLDVQGYKRSLKEERLDPGILYASILLTLAMTNHLMRLAAQSGVSRDIILTRLTSTDLKVEEIFSTPDALDKDARRKAGRGRAGLMIFGADDRRMGPIALTVILAVLALGGRLAWRGPVEEANTLRAVSQAMLRSISEELVEGEISRGRAKPVLLARVDNAAWQLLSLEQRRERAERIKRSLVGMGIDGALVYVEDTLAVQVERGKVILVR